MVEENVNKSTTNQVKMVVGLIVFIFGFLCPLLIPFVLNTEWNTTVKSILSGVLGIGGPEVLMILAGVIMGKENLDRVKNKIKQFFSPLAPPLYVSKLRFGIGITLFSISLLETLVHLHWDGIVLFYADFHIQYLVFWNILFLVSLYVLGGNFFNRLVGLFKYQQPPKE